jgi:uncharacterized protein (DUF305 family)
LIARHRQHAMEVAMHAQDKPHHMPYVHLGIMLVLSFVLMFGFMYAMVDRLANVYPNLNQAYMAGLMVAPMAVLELLFMGAMYPDKSLNRLIIGASLLVGLACWIGIREQTAISDKSFLKSMIPHHAGAILMCNKAPITDPQTRKLCAGIVKSQQVEIDEMKDMLNRLK